MIIVDFVIDNLSWIIFLWAIIFFLIFDKILKIKIWKIKNELNNKYSEEEIEELNNLEQDIYVEYYMKINKIHLIRLSILILLISSILIYKIPTLFSFFAIAVWAIIIAFKEMIISFFWFFYTSTNYKIWDWLILDDWKIRWEIFYINVLNVWLLWKDENWEHNWEFYTIPNFKFLTDYTKKEENSVHKFKKEEVHIYYSNTKYKDLKFKTFLINLKEYLDDKLDKKTIKTVWNYKTFIWYKYKLRFKIEDEKIIIKIFLITKPKDFIRFNEELTIFVESQKYI